MKNKNLLIGLGILAIAGFGYYMWSNKKSSAEEESESFTGVRKTKSCCVKEANGKCLETKEVYYRTPCPNPKKAEARTIPMPLTGVCPKGYMKGVNDSYCKPIPSGGRYN